MENYLGRFGLILFLTLTGCKESTITSEVETSEVIYTAYEWNDLNGYDSGFGKVTSIEVDSADILYMSTEKGLYKSNDRGETFQELARLGSFKVNRIRISEKNYLLGYYKTRGSEVRFNRYVTTNDPEEWKVVYESRTSDYIYDYRTNVTHHGGDWGVSSYNHATDEQYNTFIKQTELPGGISSFLLYPSNIILVATFYGVFESSDNGKTWSNSFKEEISKRTSGVYSLRHKNGYLVGLGDKSKYGLWIDGEILSDLIHIKSDDEFAWSHYHLKAANSEMPVISSEFDVDNHFNILLPSKNGLFIAKLKNEQPEFINAGPYDMNKYEEGYDFGVRAFSNGDVILSLPDGLKYGTRNTEFVFPQF